MSLLADVRAFRMCNVMMSSMVLIDEDDRSSHVSGVSIKIGSTS